MKSNAKRPTLQPKLTPEQDPTAFNNMLREAWGHPPFPEKATHPDTPFSWPISTIAIFNKAELNMNVAIQISCLGFDSREEKAPAHMATTLIGSLLDGFAILAKADRFDTAWHQLDLLDRILECAKDSFDIVKKHPDSGSERKAFFMRRMEFRIKLAGDLLSQLRGVLKCH